MLSSVPTASPGFEEREPQNRVRVCERNGFRIVSYNGQDASWGRPEYVASSCWNPPEKIVSLGDLILMYPLHYYSLSPQRASV